MKTIRQKYSLFFQLWKPCIIGLWVVLIVLCFLNRDALSVSDILQYSPANPFLAAFVMVLLFALKSLTVVLFCGFLYAAAGILFPLPVALLVNLIGTVIMATLPYYLGQQMGNDAANRVVLKYPKAEQLRALRQGNDGFLSFVTRLIVLLPGDVVSFFMGAIGVGFKKYITGSMFGFLPLIITCTIMGTNITNPHSRAFITAVCVQGLYMVVSMILYFFYRKHHLSRCQGNT